MDPITQGALGAVFPQSFSSKEKMFTATCLGLISGMSADLDILISSATDPLLAWEYHRHFTHSLIFIPFGALLCCCALFYWARRRLTWRESYVVCLLGYGTHALLDACTPYGTPLLWPFSDHRIAWNNVPDADLLATTPLFVLMLIAVFSKKMIFARVGMAWIVGYLLLGVVQRERAEASAFELAQSRGHNPETVSVIPSLANIIVWKTIYLHQGDYYVDAIRTGLNTKVYLGSSVKKLDVANDFDWLDPNSQQAIDLSRFNAISNGLLSIHPNDSHYILDMRYSLLPNEANGSLGVRLHPNADSSEHIELPEQRPLTPKSLATLWSMILGR